jgi:hypothetical protein
LIAERFRRLTGKLSTISPYASCEATRQAGKPR